MAAEEDGDNEEQDEREAHLRAFSYFSGSLPPALSQRQNSDTF